MSARYARELKHHKTFLQSRVNFESRDRNASICIYVHDDGILKIIWRKVE